jgi:hypothetical protein
LRILVKKQLSKPQNRGRPPPFSRSRTAERYRRRLHATVWCEQTFQHRLSETVSLNI